MYCRVIVFIGKVTQYKSKNTVISTKKFGLLSYNSAFFIIFANDIVLFHIFKQLKQIVET